jgi:hypothetical protein
VSTYSGAPLRLEGIQFVTNSDGERTAVLLDLKIYGEFWEDIYDILTARQRADERREPLENVKNISLLTGSLMNEYSLSFTRSARK